MRQSNCFRTLRLTCKDLEKHLNDGTRVTMELIGLLYVDDDVTPDLVDKTVSSIKVYGQILAQPQVKKLLVERNSARARRPGAKCFYGRGLRVSAHDRRLRDAGGGVRRRALAQGVPLHRRGPALPLRGRRQGEPRPRLRQVAGRHALLLGRGAGRVGEEGEVQRRRRAVRHRRQADPGRPEGGGPLGLHGGRGALLRGDPPGDRGARPRVHRGGQGRTGRGGQGAHEGLLRVLVPPGLPGPRRVHVEDVRPDGRPPGVPVLRLGGGGRDGPGGQEGRVPEEAVRPHGQEGRPGRASRPLRPSRSIR